MIHLYISGGYVWIGAWDKYNNDVQYWLDGTLLRDGYTNWGSGEPDGGRQNYMCISLSNKKWWDSSGAANYYLCEVVVN